ncbi:MAG: hypothetical protein JJE47_00730 [Acidimicrobiia bacterium]|nr:hypothetical protein [Acidimicrobiia bacterium]
MTDHPGSNEFTTADPNLDNSDRPFSLTRTIKPILMILVLGFEVHILLPQLDQLQRGLEALRSGRWPFLLITVACSGLVFVAGAFTVRSSTSSPPNWLPAITTQAAAGFASAITPGGLGWIAVPDLRCKRRALATTKRPQQPDSTCLSPPHPTSP